MKLFKARNKNKKKWHARALMIDPHKTTITLKTSKDHHSECRLPPWIYKSLLGEGAREEMGEGPTVEDSAVLQPQPVISRHPQVDIILGREEDPVE
jgi:hypothetical protein